MPVKDLLAQMCAAYNRGVTIKRHRLDGARRTVIYNLLRAPQKVVDLVSEHYDRHRHKVSGWGMSLQTHHQSHLECTGLAGAPLDILGLDFWVPGQLRPVERFRKAEPWSTIMRTSNESAIAWLQRATQEQKRWAQVVIRLETASLKICVVRTSTERLPKTRSARPRPDWTDWMGIGIDVTSFSIDMTSFI